MNEYIQQHLFTTITIAGLLVVLVVALLRPRKSVPGRANVGIVGGTIAVILAIIYRSVYL